MPTATPFSFFSPVPDISEASIVYSGVEIGIYCQHTKTGPAVQASFFFFFFFSWRFQPFFPKCPGGRGSQKNAENGRPWPVFPLFFFFFFSLSFLQRFFSSLKKGGGTLVRKTSFFPFPFCPFFPFSPSFTYVVFLRKEEVAPKCARFIFSPLFPFFFSFAPSSVWRFLVEGMSKVNVYIAIPRPP